MKYKNFKISELFDIDRGNIQNQGSLISDIKGVNFIAQNDTNNGFVKKVSIGRSKLFFKNSIIIGRQTGVVYFQGEDFVTTDGVLVLKDKREIIKNSKIGLYLVSLLKKRLKLFGYSNTVSATKLYLMEIVLPVTETDEIYFNYMEARIRELEEARIRELEEARIRELNAYLQVTGLYDYILSEEDQKLLKKFREGGVPTKKFKIGGENGLFNINTPKKKFNANIVTFGGSFPYVVRTENNNGIRGYINKDVQFLNDAHTISFGQDTATIFYQDKPYFTGDKIKIFSLKNNSLNREKASYLISAMKKSFSNFSWGNSSFSVDILEKVEIDLPVTVENKPDLNFMEKFIKIQQKLVIKNVIEWRDKQIKLTHKIVNS